MTVMVAGSRAWTDLDAITLRLLELPKGAYLIHGGAAGADQLASIAASSIGIPQRAYLPDYNLHGAKAPHVRNDEMLAAADVVLAFWDGSSRGTASVIKKARERGVQCEVFEPAEARP